MPSFADRHEVPADKLCPHLQQGYLVDRFGARLLIGAGCLLSGLGWVSAAYATSLTGLYLTYGLFCGIGTGIVYVGIIGLMVRWFPDRRGLATGLVAAGYGFGAILTTFPIDTMMKQTGYQHTLVVFGIVLGIVGMAAAFAIRMPTSADILPPPPALASHAGTPPREMLRSKVFWLMFFMMTMMSTGGLMIISQSRRSPATSASPMSWCSDWPRCRWRLRSTG